MTLVQGTRVQGTRVQGTRYYVQVHISTSLLVQGTRQHYTLQVHRTYRQGTYTGSTTGIIGPLPQQHSTQK